MSHFESPINEEGSSTRRRLGAIVGAVLGGRHTTEDPFVEEERSFGQGILITETVHEEDVDEGEIEEAHKDGFGHKSIGPVGSIILLFNNLSGPGVVGLPLLFQQAGWFMPMLSMTLIGFTTWLSGSMLCEAMRYYPGNKGYNSRIEFSTLIKFYFGKKFYLISQLIFILAMQAVNVTSIIETAQVMDLVVLKIFGKTGAIEFYPHFGWTWAYVGNRSASPFSSDLYVLSFGFVITLILIIPLGYFNLDDNMIVQKGAFFVACVIFFEWFVLFFVRISEGQIVSVPVFGTDLAPVFGTIMFNYAMVVTVPSWCNEKTHTTRVNRSMGGAVGIGTFLFFVIGWIGALAYPIDANGGDLLSAIDEESGNIAAQIGVYFFPLAVVATSIPIYSIIIRYNLIENNICGKKWANFHAVILPWLVVVPFYNGNGLDDIINWSTYFSTGIINFIIPFMIYIKARKYKMSRTGPEREELDTPVSNVEPEETYCFGKIHIPPKRVEERPHFVFGRYFPDESSTPIIISYVFVASFIICNIGIIIINILQALNIP